MLRLSGKKTLAQPGLGLCCSCMRKTSFFRVLDFNIFRCQVAIGTISDWQSIFKPRCHIYTGGCLSCDEPADFFTKIESIFDFRYVRLYDVDIPKEKRCKYLQTVETRIRRRVLRRLIWICTVCQLPVYGFPVLIGLHSGENKCRMPSGE